MSRRERMFVDREAELAFLNSALKRERPSRAQLILVYGRRRVGKTYLLHKWAEAADVPYTFWVGQKEPAGLQRRRLMARVMGVPINSAPAFESWGECWEQVHGLIGEERRILVLDEFPYAAEADSAMLSSLQSAWDRYLKESGLVIVLCGSHVQAMETLLRRQSPLFGRLTGQWHVEPLEFGSLEAFLPGWSAADRVEAYAIVGGVPAYLEWLDSGRSLGENIAEVVLGAGSMFVAEPTFLLNDELREARTHVAILEAIGSGRHGLSEIAEAALVGRTHVPAYLIRLQELRLIERRIPATVPPAKRRKSRRGQYHIADPYFRFYFRFVAPHREELAYEREAMAERIRTGLASFVGATAFEEVSREWVRREGRAGRLPLQPEVVGRHWGHGVEVDVVAVDWERRQILLGECKWVRQRVGRDVVCELVAGKAPEVLAELPNKGKGWRAHYAIFTRAGLTDAAKKVARQHNVLQVGLAELERGLARTREE
jgi:AAA+ ATPase superfamily predicted ATPase